MVAFPPAARSVIHARVVLNTDTGGTLHFGVKACLRNGKTPGVAIPDLYRSHSFCQVILACFLYAMFPMWQAMAE